MKAENVDELLSALSELELDHQALTFRTLQGMTTKIRHLCGSWLEQQAGIARVLELHPEYCQWCMVGSPQRLCATRRALLGESTRRALLGEEAK